MTIGTSTTAVDVDLLDTIRELLVDTVAPLLDGRIRFEIQVAASALALVRRQVVALAEADGEDPLAELGLDDPVALADAIERGDFDSDPHRVLPVLRRLVDRELAVTNPRYRSGREPGADAEPLAAGATEPRRNS